MFELSLIELLFIAIVGLVVIGPQDLPKVLAAIIRVFKQLQEAVGELRGQVDALVDESGVNDVKREVKYIVDQNGELQETYDISDFLKEDRAPFVGGDYERGDAEEQSKEVLTSQVKAAPQDDRS